MGFDLSIPIFPFFLLQASKCRRKGGILLLFTVVLGCMERDIFPVFQPLVHHVILSFYFQWRACFAKYDNRSAAALPGKGVDLPLNDCTH